MVLEAAAWRVEHEGQLATMVAWLTVKFDRTKKLPSLQKLLKTKTKPQPQTVEQQAAIIRMLHASLGGELKANG